MKILVRAIALGTYPDVETGLHRLRQVGEVFEITTERHFSKVWMERITAPVGTGPAEQPAAKAPVDVKRATRADKPRKEEDDASTARAKQG